MYQNFISRHQSSIIVLVDWPYAHRGVLQLTEASSLGPDSPRASPRNETVKQWRRQMTMANSPVQWPSWTRCRTWWNHSWHSSWAALNQRCFASFVRALLWCIDIMSFHSEPQRCFWLLPIGMNGAAPTVRRCLTVEQLLHLSDWIWTGRATQIDAKTKFRFGNIVPKQWKLSGFVQRTSANSIYKDDNKISQQQRVLHMNKMLERVTHFQTSFSVGIQPLS